MFICLSGTWSCLLQALRSNPHPVDSCTMSSVCKRWCCCCPIMCATQWSALPLYGGLLPQFSKSCILIRDTATRGQVVWRLWIHEQPCFPRLLGLRYAWFAGTVLLGSVAWDPHFCDCSAESGKQRERKKAMSLIPLSWNHGSI